MNKSLVVKILVLIVALFLNSSAYALTPEFVPPAADKERTQNKTEPAVRSTSPSTVPFNKTTREQQRAVIVEEPARRNPVIVPSSRAQLNKERHEKFNTYRHGDRPDIGNAIRASRYFESPAPVRRGLRQPSRGHIWVDLGGIWNLVVAPPRDGPYIWIEDRWEPDYEVPEGYEWVPGYWGRYGWVAGHWVAAPEPPYSGLRWTSGYWNSSSIWVQGYWEGRHPHGKRWISAHRSSNGYNWIPGRWR